MVGDASAPAAASHRHGDCREGGVFSTVVTLDQALVPFSRQPTARSGFYDQVWGVDPVASSLPLRDGVLLNTGYGPGASDYAAYYPLLGGSFRMRRVIVADSSGANSSTAGIVPTMRRAHLLFAYASVVPSERTTVRAIYSPKYFRLVRDSGVVAGKKIAARRCLYRYVPSSDPDAIRRNLFRLR